MKFKIKRFATVLAIAALSAAPATQAREFADIYTECGLGALIAPSNSAVAAVTNVTWDLGTTAISSNISSPDTCKGGKAKTAALLFEAMPSIERDLALGQGDHLTALLSLSGCSSDNVVLVDALRSDHAADLAGGPAEQDRYQRAERFYQRLNSRVAEQGQACQIS